jgi:pectate lyase
MKSFMLAQEGFGACATGGADGENVTVTNAADFTIYATSSLPYTITISGTVTLTSNLKVKSNKTIQGADSNSTVNGGIYIQSGVRNIIVRDLNLTNSPKVGEGDGITIMGGRSIFITHCTFIDCADGMCDITNQADSVTISWCRFRYVNQTTHRYVNLIGSNDTAPDLGYLRVTIHHCWYDQLCNERMPSVRFGRVHVYNNYYDSDSALYCVRSRLYAECLVENNYFEHIINPWEQALSKANGTIAGKLCAVNNNIAFMDTTNDITWLDGWYQDASIISKLIPGTDTVFAPPYTYILDDAHNVNSIVTANAGNKGHSSVDVHEPASIISKFLISQNYPNPFNPTTIIKYQVATSGHVCLTVFNVLGKVITTLVNEFKKPGNYTVQWIAKDVPSGVYFYQMKTREFLQAKKMQVLK